MNYNKLTTSLFFDLQHVGELDCALPMTVCSRISVAKNQCSELYLACDQNGWITQAYFKALGEPYLIAGLEWLCRNIVHTSIETHPNIDHAMIVDALSIPEAQYAVALLVETNYRQAIQLLTQKWVEKNDG